MDNGINLQKLQLLQSHAFDVLRMLKGWQAIPAAILAVYLVVGLFVAPDWNSSVRLDGGKVVHDIPPLGTHPDSGKLLILGVDYRDLDLFEYILLVASRIARYALPAALLGLAVGWVAAYVASRLSRRLRYVAYAGMAAAFIPSVVSGFDLRDLDLALFPVWFHYGGQLLALPIIELQPDSGTNHRITYSWFDSFAIPAFKIVRITVQAVPAMVCAFLIMTFRYSYNSTTRLRPPLEDFDDNNQDLQNVPSAYRDRTLLWGALSFFAGLSVVIFIYLPLLPAQSELVSLFPYYDREECERVVYFSPSYCYDTNNAVRQWYSWMPTLSVLVVLASAVLMVKWVASSIVSESGRGPPRLPRVHSTRQPSRSAWLPAFFTLAGAVVLAVLAGAVHFDLITDWEDSQYVAGKAARILAVSSETAILAGALCGVAFAILASYDSKRGGIAFTIFVTTMIMLCSLALLLMVTQGYYTFGVDDVYVFIPFMTGALGSVALTAPTPLSRARRFLFAVFVPVVIALSLTGLHYVLYELSYLRAFNYSLIQSLLIVVVVGGVPTLLLLGIIGGIALTARTKARIMVPIVLISIILAAVSWTAYAVGFVNAFIASMVFVVVIPLISLAFALPISMYRSVRSGYDVFVWGGLGSILLFLLVLSAPQLDYVFGSYLFQDRDARGIFRGFVFRNFLLAFMIAYVWLSAIRLPARAPKEGIRGAWSALSSHLPSISVALGVVVAAACVTYAVASLLLNDDNAFRFLAWFGYESTEYYRLTGASWEDWLRTYAFGVLIVAVLAAGLYAYTRLRRNAEGQGRS